MKMSDLIADFIGEMLSDGGGVAEVQRKSLADRFSCVPSQINYVIETRFTPEHGYLVESQRGGGGYIRIVRLMDDKQRTLLEAARGVGGRLTQNDAARLTRALVSADLLSPREGQLLLSACSDGALAEVAKEHRDRLRASIFRCAVMGIATTLVGMVCLASAVPHLVWFMSYVYEFGSALSGDMGVLLVVQLIASLLSSLGPALVVLLLVDFFLATVLTLVGHTAVGLWMRQFDVPSWGRDEDPLPTPVSDPRDRAGAEETPQLASSPVTADQGAEKNDEAQGSPADPGETDDGPVIDESR